MLASSVIRLTKRRTQVQSSASGLSMLAMVASEKSSEKSRFYLLCEVMGMRHGSLQWSAALCIVAFCLLGCDGSKPPADSAEEVVRSAISSESGGRIKLVRFTQREFVDMAPEKSDGVLGIWKLTTEIEFTADCIWNGRNFHTSIEPSALDQDQGPSGAEMMKKGQRQTGQVLVHYWKDKGKWTRGEGFSLQLW